MRKLVFKTAWELVKSMGISLSNALKISWLEVKIDMLEKQIQILNGTAFTYKEVKRLEKIQFPLIKILNEFKPCYVSLKENRYTGAYLFYGLGTYNGD